MTIVFTGRPRTDAPPPCPPGLFRYWIRFRSGNYEDEGCTAPPFTFWITGQTDRVNPLRAEEQAIYDLIKDEVQAERYLDDNAKDDCYVCALVEAPLSEAIWPVVHRHFPDAQEFECMLREPDWLPGDRMGEANGGLIKTGLS